MAVMLRYFIELMYDIVVKTITSVSKSTFNSLWPY